MTRTLIALLWILMLLAGSGRKMHAQVSEQDSLALVALYNATNGPNWAESTNWLQSPVSRWKGIDVAGGRVTTIDLNVNQLRGTIPPELGSLTGLIDLRLEHNQLTGLIPPELGNLTKLKDLRLVSNQLTGSIPTELGNLANLTDLRLNHNQLSGSIPAELGNLANLTLLRLVNNHLAGPIPPELGNLAKLKGLNVGNNQLTGSIPPELGNLTNLTDLHLNHNQFTGAIPPELGKLVNLNELSLASNQFSGSIPPEMSNLVRLTFLSISGNPLSGTLPLSLTDLSMLNTFLFDETNLCEPIDDNFKAWLEDIADVSSTGCMRTPTGEPIPMEIVLDQNYPNPFNSTTNIEYALPDRAAVRLTVYDLQGRLVAVLVDAEQSSGQHEVSFVADGLPSGIYSYRLEAGGLHEVRHMLLFR